MVARTAYVPAPRRRVAGVVAVAALLAATLMSISAWTAAPVAGAGSTLYVDGKTGNDSHSGLTWQAALRTINEAARRVPRGSSAAGWKVVVRGYADHVYRERPIPGGYDRWGSAGSPLVFEAEGWSAGATDYVKPIVSGGALAPAAGDSWHTTSTSGVWWTGWSTAPRGFVAGQPFEAALFQDGMTWLWQRASLADLLDSVGSAPSGGYWFDKGAQRLYVATAGGVSPSSVKIEVPTNNGFYFSGAHGAKYIEVRGFVVRHAAMGVAFVDGVDYSAAVDMVAEANSHLGFQTSGRVTGGGSFDPAVGNSLLRNAGSANTIQLIKVDAGSQGTTVCDNSASGNGMQGIKVQGPTTGAADPRVTSDTLVCDNKLFDQVFVPPDAPYANTTGLTVSDGALDTDVRYNKVWGNNIGIHITQQSAAGLPLDGTRLYRNQVWDNVRFGLDVRDGYDNPASGTGSLVSRYNLYWGNGIGVLVDRGSTNKTFNHDTIHDNQTVGFKVGCACSSWDADATLRNSLVTDNGTYGVMVTTGHSASVLYTGLHGNAWGNFSGTVSTTGVNSQAPGYQSLVEGGGGFLRITTASYQYTAGPTGDPIGARY